MSSLSKQQIIQACRLYKKSLAQAKQAAIAIGWMPNFVEEVANLDYSLHYLQSLNRKGQCSKRQLNAILAVRDTASLEICLLYTSPSPRDS